MEIEEFLATPKENKLAVDGTMAILEFAYAIYLTSWVAGFLGIFFYTKRIKQ